VTLPEAVGEDRAADGHAEAAADRAEEGRPGGRHAEVAVVDVVLHGEHEHLHDEADPQAEDEHVERAFEGARVRAHRREPPEADDHERGTGDRERAVVTPPRDDLPAADRGDEQPEDQRQQLEAGAGRRGAGDDLQEERQVGRRAEEAEADDEADRARHGEHAAGEQAHRQHRLGRALLDRDEQRGGGDGDDAEADDLPRAPAVGLAAQARRQHEAAGGEAEQDRAEHVDACLATLLWHAQGDRDHRKGDDPDRQVDVEDPAPRGVVDQEAADQRPGHAADPEDGTEDALVAAAVARRDDVADDRLREDDEPAAAEALHRAEGDELAHALGLAAQRRPDEEDDDRGLEDALATVEVAELAVERRRDRRGQQVAGDDPRELVEAAELGRDSRQRGRDDRPVERRQQDRQHERREDDQDLATRTRRRSRQRGRRSGHAGQLRASAPATPGRASPRRRPRPRGRPGR
jgi:hypothetical protein